MSDEVLAGRHLVHSYGAGARRIDVLRDVSLAVHGGEFAALVGRSGSGKTTLLQILGLLAAPAGGDVIIDGAPVRGATNSALARLRRDTLGFVFQAGNLLPQHDAVDNVLMPWNDSRAAGRARAMELLERFGIAERAHHRPDQLSGGEQQRVALARALVNEPRVVLADEPTGSLDLENERTLLRLLRELADEGTAVLVITHSNSVAAATDTTWRLVDGWLSLSSVDSAEESAGSELQG